MKKRIAIVGVGRFGKVLVSLLKQHHCVLFDKHPININDFEQQGITIATSLAELADCDTIFYAVPIGALEQTLQQHRPYLKNHTVVDVLSVKEYPQTLFKKYLPNTVEALLTHPMFGPDALRVRGITGLPMVFSNHSATQPTYSYWKSYFAGLGIRVIELTPKQHDQYAARSQGVTHFIGRLLDLYRFSETPIDTIGAVKLREIMDVTCHDTWELFTQLQTKNRYTPRMRIALGKAFDNLHNKLLPQQKSEKRLTIGIQGGKASFNEVALNDYITRHKLKNVHIRYLYTTEKVLKNLHAGSIDYGLFAIHNSVGGMVKESINAISRYTFEIVEEFGILIQHMLMKLPRVQLDSITEVIAHDQVLKQCAATLSSRYPQLKQLTGTGDYIDTATAARGMVEGKLPENRYVLGNRAIASTFGFDIVAENLQDNKNNITSFLMVKRPESLKR